MKSFKEYIKEVIKVPISVGDTVLGGKFKNKRIVVKSIGKNDKGDIAITKKSDATKLMKFLVSKHGVKKARIQTLDVEVDPSDMFRNPFG